MWRFQARPQATSVVAELTLASMHLNAVGKRSPLHTIAIAFILLSIQYGRIDA